VEAAIVSNHSLLTFCLDNRHGGKHKSNFFCYEACWALEEDSHAAISKAWQQSVGGPDNWSHLGAKLKVCKRDLLMWQQSIQQPSR
jgi:hypothetical protein